MGIRGLDISEHQRGMDVERVVRDNNIDFVFVRTNYGANHDDLYFHQHCDAAERAGALVLPYVYVLASDIRGSIDDCVRIVGGRYDSASVDWEHGSGGGAELRRAHELLWERGFSTPVVYDPKWYWESVGSPDLSWMQGKVKGHWKSWYADNSPRSYADALSRVPDYVWNDNRGGIPTVIVQFSGTGRLPGYSSNLDLNYFPGSRTELAALLGKDDDMSWETPVTISSPGDRQYTETHPAKTLAGDTYFWTADLYKTVPGMLAAILAAVTDGLDEEAVLAQVDTSVQKATTEVFKSSVVPALRDVVRDVLGEDNDEQADAIVDRLGERLRVVA